MQRCVAVARSYHEGYLYDQSKHSAHKQCTRKRFASAVNILHSQFVRHQAAGTTHALLQQPNGKTTQRESKRPHREEKASPYLTVVIVIAVKMYVNSPKISIVGPKAASSKVPVHCNQSSNLNCVRVRARVNGRCGGAYPANTDSVHKTHDGIRQGYAEGWSCELGYLP